MTDLASRRTIALLFAVYLALLVWAVLWKLHVPFIGHEGMRGIKLVPFVPGDGFGRSAPREVLANIVLFVPVGVFLGALVRRAWWRAAAVIPVTSIVLETAQFVLAAGSSDVTDVITNTAGGLAGFALLWLVRGRVRSRILVPMLAAGTAAAVLAVAAVVLTLPRPDAPVQGMPRLSSAVVPAR